ncbi:MAG: hypothetical protein LBD79_10730 [Treponema sp.]|nr:hypothetical protein [Treponema sp.]
MSAKEPPGMFGSSNLALRRSCSLESDVGTLEEEPADHAIGVFVGPRLLDTGERRTRQSVFSQTGMTAPDLRSQQFNAIIHRAGTGSGCR